MSRRLLMSAIALMLQLAAACSSGVVRPAELDTRTDTCAVCRMLVSDRPLASQIVAPHEDPIFFDHPRCLAEYLKTRASLPAGATIYAGDRAGGWTPIDRAAAIEAGAAASNMGGGR
jgi:nitrous oxide reductase accessory protein NosL